MLILDTLINLFQAIVDGIFLVGCLEKKEKYEKWQVYVGIVVPVFFYMELQTFLTEFEGNAVIIITIFTVILSYVFCKADILTNVVYNIVLTITAVFSSIIGAGIVGIICGASFLQLTVDETAARAFAIFLIQIIWLFFIVLIMKMKKSKLSYFNKKYTFMALLIPVLSIWMCTVILTKLQTVGKNIVWELAVVFGIFVLNIIDFALLNMVSKSYEKNVRDEIIIRSYKQQKNDIVRIKEENDTLAKNRHEIKRVLNLMHQMLQDNENDKAIAYLDELNITNIVQTSQKLFTDNLIINYILNRTDEKCEQDNIDFMSAVNGPVNGISDMDIHILMDNLIDNALEAIANAKEKFLSVSVNANEYCINIEVINSTKGNVLVENPDFKTTKSDKLHHGYGMKNIREIVGKYQGSIGYECVEPESLRCRIVLIKTK